MYSPALTSPFSSRRAVAPGLLYSGMAATTGVVGASPHRLVAMLFDGLSESLARARGAIAQGQIAIKAQALARAVRIVEEGLRPALNLRDGGELASDLNELYAYIVLRLARANLDNDAAAIEECQRLTEPLASAWAAIGERHGATL